MQHNSTPSADRQTIDPATLKAFTAAIAAIDSTEAKARVAAAQAEVDRIAAAQRAGNERLDEIAYELRKQPDQAADDVADALITGGDVAELTRPRDALNQEGAQLRAGLAKLAGEHRAAVRALEQAKASARRPYKVEAAKLVDAIAATAREHIAGLLSCYAAANAISRSTDAHAGGLISALKDIVFRAQVRGGDLLECGERPVDVPADALQAMEALAELGPPFDFAAISRVAKP